MYDLFISYAHQDKTEVTELVARLRHAGLSVWFDETDVPAHFGISSSIGEGLKESKALLAYYSKVYPTRRPCQWELTYAFLTAQRAGDPRKRVLVINPERSADHIHPIELRDALYQTPGDPNLPARVRTHIRQLSESLGILAGAGEVPWFGHPGPGPRRFVGRLPELWQVHSLLAARSAPIITHKAGMALAQIAGLGGIGKSMLAEEYGARFAGAYPGGIFWLRAYGHDDAEPAQDSPAREAERQSQFRAFAALLGLSTEQRSIEEVEGRIREALQKRGRSLWIIDDVPPGLTLAELQKWFAPDPAACNLLTTRSGEYRELGGVLDLSTLDPDDAVDLLCSFRAPASEAERDAAARVCGDLGRHALAIAVIGSRLAASTAPDPFAAVLEELHRVDADALELAARFVGLLPTGHETSITATLLRSIRLLGAEGLDVLRLAAVLAVAPIPLRLIGASFAKADGLEASVTQDRVDLGVHQTEKMSLSERTDGYLSVHGLVSRVVRFQEPAKDRIGRLKSGAIEALVAELPKSVGDWRAHPEIEFDVIHARQLMKDRSLDAAFLLNYVGAYDYERGAYDSAEQSSREFIQRLNEIPGHDELKAATARLALAEVLREKGDPSAALKLQKAALQTRRLKLGSKHYDTLVAMTNIARTYFALGDVQRALELQKDAAEGLTATAGAADPHTLTAIAELATSFVAIGEYRSALKLQTDVLEISTNLRGSDHRDTLATMNSLGVTKRFLGDIDGALALQREATRRLKNVAGARHQTTLAAMNQLAYTLFEMDQLDEAENLFREMYEARKQMFGEADPDTLNSFNGLASVLCKKGKAQEAAPLLESAVRSAAQTSARSRLAMLVIQGTLAQAYELLNQPAKAVALLEQIVPEMARVSGKQHPNTTAVASELMSLYGNSGSLRWREIFDKYLRWIMEVDPDMLTGNQRQLREEWAQVLPRKQSGGLLRRLFGRSRS